MPGSLNRHNTQMRKTKLKRYLPSPQDVRTNKALRPVEHLLARSEIWHLNRRSAAGAVFIGLFCAFIPLPMQMIMAASPRCGHALQLTHRSRFGLGLQPNHHRTAVLLHLSTRRVVVEFANLPTQHCSELWLALGKFSHHWLPTARRITPVWLGCRCQRFCAD